MPTTDSRSRRHRYLELAAELDWIGIEAHERAGRVDRLPADELAERVNTDDRCGPPLTGEQLRRWLVEAGYAETDEYGWVVLKPDARRLASEAFG